MMEEHLQDGIGVAESQRFLEWKSEYVFEADE
jgi:hypothetical protein